MGHTTYALSALLSSYLGGLALGALIASRWIAARGDAKKVSVREYVLLEFGVALSALLVEPLTTLLGPTFGWAYLNFSSNAWAHSLLLAVLCAFLILPACVLMGMTLPIAVALITQGVRSDSSRASGILYASNSLGAVLGAACAGLFLLPRLGAAQTLAVGVVLNVCAGLFSLALRWTRELSPQMEGSEQPAVADWPAPRALPLWYAGSGFGALCLQVGWARVVALSVGSTLYGLAMTLSAFILGIALGSALIPRFERIRRAPARALFALHALIALWIVWSVGWLGALPLRIGRHISSASFEGLWRAQALVVLATILVPTFAMGGIFPLLAQMLRRGGRDAAGAVGLAYGANTLGNLSGAAIAGFLLIPALGTRGTILASGILFALIACGIAMPAAIAKNVSIRTGGRLPVIALVLFTVFGVLRAPSWDPDLLTSAPYFSGYQAGVDKPGQRHKAPRGSLVDFQEGPSAVIAVREWAGNTKVLYAGGVVESSRGAPLHRFLGHLPILLHGRARSALIVGLGVGNTLASVASHDLERVDCLEISEEVAKAAKEHFSEVVDAPLRRASVELILADGRAHLQHTPRRYDVIVSQPSYPWMSGAARLFTREYFELIRGRLAKGGVAVIWFSDRSTTSTESLLKTWASVFENAYLFSPGPRWPMHFAVGFESGELPDARRIAALLHDPEVRAAVNAIGIRSAQDLLLRLRRLPKGAEDIPLNTDDNGFVEFRLFRALTDARPERSKTGVD